MDSVNNEQVSRAQAIAAWVESELAYSKTFEARTIEIVKGRLAQMSEKALSEVENSVHGLSFSTRQFLFQNLENVELLAHEVFLIMKGFFVLDKILSTQFCDWARLPQKLLEDENLHDYIEAAQRARESAKPHLQFLELLQENDNKQDPNLYACIFASSGTGKTQLAATASITYKNVSTIYLLVGSSGTQRFYGPHASLETEKFWEQIGIFVKQKSNGAPSATKIKIWAENNDDGTQTYSRLLYHLLLGVPFRQSVMDSRMKLSAVKEALRDKKLFVFLDEVPVKSNTDFQNVLCLTNTLRYLGIAPILMSTHTGAQDFVAEKSRESLDTWTWIVSALPKYSLFRTLNNPPRFLMDTERPLVLKYARDTMKTSSDLLYIVHNVRDNLQGNKRLAWTTSPGLQLVQLFETDVLIDRGCFPSAHKLVGHHFGWLVQGGEEGRKKYGSLEAEWFSDNLQVAPVSASTEPILYLALVTWNEEMLKSNGARPLFPLVNNEGIPLTIRGAFNRCNHNFQFNISTDNPNAEKLSGNLLEVLVHASLTLASMKIIMKDDIEYLGGMSMKLFVPLVRHFMVKETFEQMPTVPSLFDSLNYDWPSIPALGSSNSRLPEELISIENLSTGFLERPADNVMNDGQIYYNVRSCKNPSQPPFATVECKNYTDGVDGGKLKGVFKRIQSKVQCCLVFVSSLKGELFARTSLDDLKQECFQNHDSNRVSVVVWDQSEEEPHYLKVGARKEEFMAENTNIISLLVVIIVVGKIEANATRKRKIDYPPCANR